MSSEALWQIFMWGIATGFFTGMMASGFAYLTFRRCVP
jgi:hypothetical protein